MRILITKVEHWYFVETYLGDNESQLESFENPDELLSYLIESLKLNYP